MDTLDRQKGCSVVQILFCIVAKKYAMQGVRLLMGKSLEGFSAWQGRLRGGRDLAVMGGWVPARHHSTNLNPDVAACTSCLQVCAVGKGSGGWVKSETSPEAEAAPTRR